MWGKKFIYKSIQRPEKPLLPDTKVKWFHLAVLCSNPNTSFVLVA